MSRENEVEKVSLPNGMELGKFVPTAYFDKHMDCIRVMTHDRSITEIRLNEYVTLYECNHRSDYDPEFVGFTLKGVRSMYEAAERDINSVYNLVELLDTFVSLYPDSTMAVTLGLIGHIYKTSGDIIIQPSDGVVAQAA